MCTQSIAMVDVPLFVCSSFLMHAALTCVTPLLPISVACWNLFLFFGFSSHLLLVYRRIWIRSILFILCVRTICSSCYFVPKNLVWHINSNMQTHALCLKNRNRNTARERERISCWTAGVLWQHRPVSDEQQQQQLLSLCAMPSQKG